MTPLGIKRKYKARILRILENLAAALRHAGIETSKPEDYSGDDYVFGFMTTAEKANDQIRVDFKIAESEQYDGTKDGVNFLVSLVWYGGLIIGDYSPYNFTPSVWLGRDDKAAVEHRFCLMEEMDVAGTVGTIKEAIKRKQSQPARA